MKRSLQIVLLAVFALLTASAAEAADAKKDNPQPKPVKRGIQFQGRPVRAFAGGTYNSSNWLLRNPKVQEELKLTDDQQSKIKEAQDQLRTASQELFGAARGLQGQDRAKKYKEASEKLRKKSAETNKAIRDVLKKEQAQRLDQISLQQKGLRALSDEKVAGKLKITDEQQQKIADVQAESRQQRIKLGQDVRNGNVERAKYREKSQEITKETEKNTLEVLTKEQQAAFDKLKGKKFEFPRRQFRAIQVQPGQLKNIQGQPKRIQIQIQPGQIQGKPQKIQIQIQGGGKIQIIPQKKEAKPNKVS